MAETGGIGGLRSEAVAAGQDVSEIIEQRLGGGGTPTSSFEITVSGEHAAVTLASMLAPSPDWFVGVSGLSLLGGPTDLGYIIWRQIYSRMMREPRTANDSPSTMMIPYRKRP